METHEADAARAAAVLEKRARELAELIESFDIPKEVVWAKDAIMPMVHKISEAYFDYAHHAWLAQIDRGKKEE